jgi:peptidoglycan/LPS O-acetylase OafA/YrhL
VIAALAAWCSITWTPATSYLAPLPIAYVTMFIGLQNPGKIRLIAAGDFSYGVYLYGFPIQQTVARLLPDHRVWYIHFPASLTIAAMFAWLSWTMIESPILVRKGRATRFVDTVVRSITATWGTRPPAP